MYVGILGNIVHNINNGILLVELDKFVCVFTVEDIACQYFT